MQLTTAAAAVAPKLAPAVGAVVVVLAYNNQMLVVSSI